MLTLSLRMDHMVFFQVMMCMTVLLTFLTCICGVCFCFRCKRDYLDSSDQTLVFCSRRNRFLLSMHSTTLHLVARRSLTARSILEECRAAESGCCNLTETRQLLSHLQEFRQNYHSFRRERVVSAANVPFLDEGSRDFSWSASLPSVHGFSECSYNCFSSTPAKYQYK